MRARWMMTIAGAIAVAVAVSGCGPASGGGGSSFSGCSTRSEGVVSLAWTIRGQTPTAQSCAGIDHLVLDIAPEACLSTAEISPVPCALDRAQYAHIPEGYAYVQLTGLDAAGQIVVQGAARAPSSADTTTPTAPTPIDLR